MSELQSPYLDPLMAQYYAEASGPHQFIQPARDLVRFLRISAGHRVLDIGSGSGLIAAEAASAARPAGPVLAVDSSIEMLKRQNTVRILRSVAHAEHLPFGHEVFDRITAGFVITHLHDYRKGLSEWTRVLRSGGRLGLTSWEAGSTMTAEIWKATMRKYVDAKMVEEAFSRVIPHDELFSVRTNLTQALEQAGLIDVKAETKRYSISMSVTDFIHTKIGSVEGTIVRNQMEEIRWHQFLAELFSALSQEFPQLIEYERNVHFVSAKKR